MFIQARQFRVGFGLAALLAGGCASIPEVKPASPTLQANDLAVGQDIGAAAAYPWPALDWWKVYGDPQLDQLVERALAGNPRLAAAQARIAEAQGMARGAGAALQPKVDGGADLERTRFSHDYYLPQEINGHDLFSPVWNNNAGITAAYSLDFWGRDRASLQASLDQVKVSEFDAQTVRLSLAGAVVRAYMELSYTYEIEDHDNAILSAERQTLDLAARRLKAGLGTELEIQQASNAVAATQAQREDLSNRLAILHHQLAALCGAGPGAGDTLTRPALTVIQAIGLPTRIPAELIGRRPDVLAERWRVEAAAERIAVAKAAFYPNVDLKAAVGVLGIGFGNLLSASALNTSVGPAITLPIFEGGRLRAGLEVSTSRYDMAVDAYNASIVEALHEVADQISRLQSLDILSRRRAETLSYAKRAHELAVIAFRAGLTDYNNVLSTEDALNRAQNLIADLRLQQLLSVAALNQALGGGLGATDASTGSDAPTASAPQHAPGSGLGRDATSAAALP